MLDKDVNPARQEYRCSIREWTSSNISGQSMYSH